ncbi:uncharacterized protein LOC121866579 [Homarus americanus]|uniref:Uncharacterized protein n=1 Tax=Homarus americanus TaxID=6706 RepID=A0A8J5K6Y6_HOMAM|nr:uncharacterized protein LOC121866579 [Homarus americanus]KAG7168866.1 hypothetical protein Hamer_G011537 [Homarus americanus]
MGDQESRGAKTTSSSCWRRLAPHKQPLSLRDLSQTSAARVVSRAMSSTLYHCEKDLRTVGHLLRTSLPLALRTSVLKEVTATQDLNDPQRVLSLILLHLLTDVAHIGLTAGINTGRYLQLQEEDCKQLLEELELEDVQTLSLESLQLEGVWMEGEFLSQILRRSPNIRSIQVSGDLCREVLNYLQENPCNLRSLHLNSCTVTDEHLVKALVGTGTDFCTLGNIICSGGDVTKTETVAHKSLRSLSVQSPILSVCGAMVLLHSLRELRHIQYICWSAPISDTLLLLQKVCPQYSAFALSSMDLFRPSKATFESLVALCSRLRELSIEYHETDVTSLDALSRFSKLSKLTLRMVSEELIVSAVKALGRNLMELKIEFEDYTFQPISLETVKTIQEHCPHLQTLEMLHVNIEANPSERLLPVKKILLPELKKFTLQSSLIQPPLLERLVRGNSSLENLLLDVNQDALTDQVVASLLRNNDLQHLNTIYLGAGSISSWAITSLVALPSLSRLSLVLKRFPFIPMSTISSLEDNLVMGNYCCILENVMQED